MGIAPLHQDVTEKEKQRLMAAKDKIASGEKHVFSGPVRDQSGKVRIPAGETATDKEIWSMDWFVQGVVGTTE